MQLVRFEAFRDLVKLLQLGVAEEAGILLAEDENLDARAAAKANAAAQAAQTGAQAAGLKQPAVPAGAARHPRRMHAAAFPVISAHLHASMHDAFMHACVHACRRQCSRSHDHGLRKVIAKGRE